jgi:hypothetical protein
MPGAMLTRGWEIDRWHCQAGGAVWPGHWSVARLGAYLPGWRLLLELPSPRPQGPLEYQFDSSMPPDAPTAPHHKGLLSKRPPPRGTLQSYPRDVVPAREGRRGGAHRPRLLKAVPVLWPLPKARELISRQHVGASDQGREIGVSPITVPEFEHNTFHLDHVVGQGIKPIIRL